MKVFLNYTVFAIEDGVYHVKRKVKQINNLQTIHNRFRLVHLLNLQNYFLDNRLFTNQNEQNENTNKQTNQRIRSLFLLQYNEDAQKNNTEMMQ